MFVERRQGQVGFTVGPFSGGMQAAHTISVFEEGGRIRVVDRVRLNKEEEEIRKHVSLRCAGFLIQLVPATRSRWLCRSSDLKYGASSNTWREWGTFT
jgi:hypothetical protein